MERINSIAKNANGRMATREEINAKRRLAYANKKLQSGKTYKPKSQYTTRVKGRTAEEKKALTNKTRQATRRRKAEQIKKQKAEEAERVALQKAEEAERVALQKAEDEAKALRKAIRKERERKEAEVVYWEIETFTFSLDSIFDPIKFTFEDTRKVSHTLTTGLKNFDKLNAYLPFKKDEKFDKRQNDKIILGKWKEWSGRFKDKFSQKYRVFETGMLTNGFPKPGEVRVSEIINVPSNGFTEFLREIKPKKASIRHVKKLIPVSGNNSLNSAVLELLSSLGVSESLLCWDITAVEVQRPEGTKASTILSEYLYDGSAPTLLFPTANMLEIPNTTRTCIPDILKKYDKQCFNLTTDQIKERVNATWDKYRTLYYKSNDYNRCYGELPKCFKVEKDLKQLFEYTSELHGERLTASHLVVYCTYNRIQLSILDDTTTLIMRVLTTEQIDKNKKSIMCYISNSHVYDVVSKCERTRIMNVRDNNYVKVEDKKKEVEVVDDKELPESYIDILKTDGIDTYTTYTSLERLIIDMYEKHNVLPSTRSIRCEGTVPTSLTICNKTITHNENLDKTRIACKSVNRVNHNMSISSLTIEQFEKFSPFNLDSLKSTFNDISLSFVKRLITSAIQFNTKPSKNITGIQTYDIRRCYTSVLMSITEWLTFSVFDDVKIFKPTDVIVSRRLYFVNTESKNFLFEGSGVYTYDVVTRGLSDKLISKADISHYIDGTVQNYDFSDFVEHIYNTFASDEHGDSIPKDMINMFIGCLNYRKGRSVKVSYTPNIGDVVDKYFRQEWSGYTSFTTSKGKLYKCLKITPPKDTHTLGLPVYAQIIQRARCEMHDLSNRLK